MRPEIEITFTLSPNTRALLNLGPSESRNFAFLSDVGKFIPPSMQDIYPYQGALKLFLYFATKENLFKQANSVKIIFRGNKDFFLIKDKGATDWTGLLLDKDDIILVVKGRREAFQKDDLKMLPFLEQVLKALAKTEYPITAFEFPKENLST